MTTISTIEQLEAIYGSPSEGALAKETPHVTDHYRALIEASPFAVLATSGPEGLDCSPRGDLRGFVRVHDKNTLMIPDRRGNNRTDSLRNIIRDPRVALLFLIPGSGTTLRVNGRAKISNETALCESFAVAGKAPRTVVVIDVETVYFQCARALMRSNLWNPDALVPAESIPTPGQILGALTQERLGGEPYDRAWPERAKQGMW